MKIDLDELERKAKLAKAETTLALIARLRKADDLAKGARLVIEHSQLETWETDRMAESLKYMIEALSAYEADND